MQYFKQLPNGERVQVTEDQWQVDSFHKRYLQIIAAPTVTVYRLNMPSPFRAERRVKYGGSHAMRNPFEYITSVRGG